MTTQSSDQLADDGPRVGLFATCLVDLFRPSVGFSAVELLERAGCRVEVPREQTCCGQPAYNSGDTGDARAIAEQVIAVFEGFDYVVVPSGSCGGTIKHHYPALFAGDAAWGPRAEHLANKTYELIQFLIDVIGVDDFDANYDGTITYHDSCSGLRELKIKQQPRQALSKVNGMTLIEGEEAETCCGFGGLFCVKYPDISGTMVDAKVDDILATGADTVLGGDLGCLMNISGRLTRRGSAVAVRHVAEVLAGAGETPGIGAASGTAASGTAASGDD